MFLIELAFNVILYCVTLLNNILYKNNNMDTEKVNIALKLYEAQKRASANYYERNKDKIKQKHKERYEKNKKPTGRPRGRPKKNITIENKNELPEQ